MGRPRGPAHTPARRSAPMAIATRPTSRPRWTPTRAGSSKSGGTSGSDPGVSPRPRPLRKSCDDSSTTTGLAARQGQNLHCLPVGAFRWNASGPGTVSLRQGQPGVSPPRRSCGTLARRSVIERGGGGERKEGEPKVPPLGQTRPHEPWPAKPAGEWRRRESNPRPSSHRQSLYKRVPPSDLARPAGGGQPTDRASHPWLSHLRRWRSFGAEPVRCRRFPGHGPSSGATRSATD